MNKDFIKHDDQELQSWDKNFNTKLCKHAIELGMIQIKEGAVPVNSSINVAEGIFSNEMLIVLENTGTSTLRFCISGNSTGNCNSPRGVEVFPTEVKTVTVEELGSETNIYLNVTSTSDAVPPLGGNYKVTLPDENIMNIIADGKSVIDDIDNTVAKRNEWKEAASAKNINKNNFISKILRPFIQNKIKSNDAYTEDMGKDMGIVEEGTYVNPDDMKPYLKVILSSGAVKVIWIKGQADAIHIEVDRSDGNGFVLLGVDTQPDYIDTTPLPATSTIWKYRAMYKIKDEMVGQWSDTVQIMVVK